MKLLVIAAFASLVSLSAFAQHDDEHSAEVCSTVDATICAHVGHMKDLLPGKQGSFVVHVTGPAETANMSVLLWMPSMGHGTAPVAVTQFDVNKYNVTKASFIMKGDWLVRLAFTAADVVHHIDIPLTIK